MTVQRCCGSSTHAVFCAGSAAATGNGHSTPWLPQCCACPTGAHAAIRAVPSSSASFLRQKKSAMLQASSGACGSRRRQPLSRGAACSTGEARRRLRISHEKPQSRMYYVHFERVGCRRAL